MAYSKRTRTSTVRWAVVLRMLILFWRSYGLYTMYRCTAQLKSWNTKRKLLLFVRCPYKKPMYKGGVPAHRAHRKLPHMGMRPVVDLNNKELWNLTANELSDSNQDALQRHKFLTLVEGEAITVTHEFVLIGVETLDIATEISHYLNSPVTGDTHDEYIVCGKLQDQPVIAFIEKGSGYDYNSDASIITTDIVIEIKVTLTGNRTALSTIVSNLTAKFGNSKVARVRWWYQGTRVTDKVVMFLNPLTTTLHKEFYPDINDSTPHAYLQRFLSSDASVLMMHGMPGTGKTTLLRHLIVDHQLQADIVYDEQLMDKDDIFQSFIFGKSSLLIIEDADNILIARETNNSMMARFLNVSDGLIKLPNKKLIFTTNLTDFGRVDPALIRQGRCFDVLHTRALEYEEAVDACRVSNLPIPLEQKSYTLAELFSQQANRSLRKVGF